VSSDGPPTPPELEEPPRPTTGFSEQEIMRKFDMRMELLFNAAKFFLEEMCHDFKARVRPDTSKEGFAQIVEEFKIWSSVHGFRCHNNV
jgi:hypothetical protein